MSNSPAEPNFLLTWKAAGPELGVFHPGGWGSRSSFPRAKPRDNKFFGLNILWAAPTSSFLGLFFAPVSEIQNSEIQKIRNGSFRKSEILSETDCWDFPCRQNETEVLENTSCEANRAYPFSRAGNFPVQNSKMHEAQLRNGFPRTRHWIFRIFDFRARFFPCRGKERKRLGPHKIFTESFWDVREF